MVFDIAYVTGPGQASYLAYEKVVELALSHKVLHARPLFISASGGVSECLAYKPRFVTQVPAQLGYKAPTVMPKDNPENLAEGIVIKPWDIETKPGEGRPIMKNKIVEFCETMGEIAPKGGK